LLDSCSMGRFANRRRRLKMETTGGADGDSGKNRPRNEGTGIQLRLGGMRIVEHDQTDKRRLLGWKIADERDHVLALFVAAVASDFLRSARLTGNGKSWNGCGSGRAAITYNASQRIANLSR